MTILRKKRKTMNIPFGSRVERFSSLGYHPKLEIRSGTYKYPNISPGCHDWNKVPKIISKVISWNKSLETEEYSRRLAYHGEEIVKRRNWERSINGPGWHDIPTLSSGREIAFLKNNRFPKSKLSNIPGPGTYGKNHIPFTAIEEKSREKGFSFSTLMPLEGMASRPKSLDPQPSYHLPPNVYNLKTPTEELIEKRISKRGPYDLFTGPRFQRLVVPKRVNRKETIPTSIDLNDWSHPKNNFKGKFMKCGKENPITTRMIMKDTTLNCLTTPGPNNYNVYQPKTVVPSTSPFNCSVAEIRPTLKKILLPPPGRYHSDRKKHIIGNGWRSAFLSRGERGLLTAPKWSWFDK